jgi:hypothetical protein
MKGQINPVMRDIEIEAKGILLRNRGVLITMAIRECTIMNK